jgi:hypothetical protein
VRILRSVGLFLLVGAAAAAAARVLFPSRGDAESDEVELNAVIHGETLKSRAQAFRGGTVRAWLGGVAIDLREATLAPDARLELNGVLGGIAIRVPTGWRVEANVESLAGGVAVDVPDPEDPAAPLLRIEGRTLLGGVAVGARP